MHDAGIVTQQRGLRTATGCFAGERVTVTAFGMGAPIATIVLEELVTLGARVLLRAGTAMTLSARLPLGAFVVARGAIRREGSSLSYAALDYPASAGWRLLGSCVAALERASASYQVGLMASEDGFYSRLFALTPDRAERVDRELGELRQLGALAVDMETSALLTVGSLLGIEAGALCLATVDAASRARLSAPVLATAERQLCAVALDAVTSTSQSTGVRHE